MSEREQLEQAIAALEAQRGVLGDAVVNAALAPMREKLAALQAHPPPAAEQQRKQVTVLFADVSGFTAMSETMDAEEVSATMNAVWRRLDGAITAHGGRIDKHIGDAVMALFGAPVAREDDPEQAIRAALAMQKELAEFREGMAGRKGNGSAAAPAQLQMRIGINTGPVLLGAVGTTGEYTAMGDAVNLASRLEHAAPVGGILISHDTYRHVRGVFDVAAQDPITVKGKSEPIQVYVVNRAKPRAFRVTTRGVEGVETRTIGREAELARLQAALQTARESRRTHLVNVVAEAGTGKSRLLYEFTNWLELLPELTVIFKGRATPEMERIPYSLMRSVLTFRFEIQDSDRVAQVREKLERGIVGFLGPEGKEKAHFIGHLVGFDFSGSPYLHGILGDAEQIRRLAYFSFVQLFEAVTRQGAAAFLLEDIHWADDSSLDLLQHILRERPHLPLLVMGLTRPTLFERRPEWGDGQIQHFRLDLRPLSEADGRRLVREILKKADEVPAALEDLIVRRAEGSPFYVEELIKMLIEDEVIATGEEHWHVEMGRLADVRVPATLTGVLQARLDGLPVPERETLQQASVVGRVFWSNVVERLHNPEMDLAEPAGAKTVCLQALHGKELIFQREDSVFGDVPEYIFKHAILYDVTYESVLKRLRRAYHAQVAESLIEISGERVGEYAGRIAEHFEQAGEWAQAAEWYGRAGKQAQDTSALGAAITHYQKAIELWKQSMDAPEGHLAERVEVHLGLGDVLVTQARHAEAIEAYQAARAAAEAASDALLQARAWYGLALTYVNQGDYRTALENAMRGEEFARQADSRIDLARVLWAKGLSQFWLGEADSAVALGEETLALAVELSDKRQMIRSLNLLGGIHNMSGRYQAAEDSFGRALAISQEIGDRLQAMSLLNNLGVVAEARGDYGAALDHYQEALTVAGAIGHREGELLFLNNVGGARVRLEEHKTAEADLQRVIELAQTAGTWVLGYTYCYLAEACLGQRKLDEALAAARKALPFGEGGGAQDYIGATWRVLGQVAALLLEPVAIAAKGGGEERPYDAAACFAESVRLCTEMGIEGEKARTLREWARYEAQRGDHERGATMWQEARELFAKLGATLEVERMDQASLSGDGGA